jgi:hypothetical protein
VALAIALPTQTLLRTNLGHWNIAHPIERVRSNRGFLATGLGFRYSFTHHA